VRDGLRLDDETVRKIAQEEARTTRWGRLALWIAAISLAVLAFAQLSH
jgi:ubiquinone biosynthesis protein